MNATNAVAAERLLGHIPADRPELAPSADPDAMHPRAIEMAEAMREGTTTFRALVAAGFTPAEISRFTDEARALARSRCERQIAPAGDRLSEMVDKANAAVAGHMPRWRSGAETQAMVVAWNRYCVARSAFRLDSWDGQRERCAMLLHAFFRQAAVGQVVAGYVVREAMKTMGVRH